MLEKLKKDVNRLLFVPNLKKNVHIYFAETELLQIF